MLFLRKGIPAWVDLKMNDYKSVLYGEQWTNKTIEVRSLRLNKDKEMSRTTVFRRGLTAINIKLAVQEDGISCLPLKNKDNYE